jgi:putative nucleotidyltransferase with HDIG domain
MKNSDPKFRKLEDLAPFPAVATKLLRVLSRDDVNINEIVGLVRADAALASELLRVVNSAAYAHPTSIGSIQLAVTFLGFEKVKNLALAVSVKGFLHGILRLDLVRRIWRHSLACGMICQELSSACSSSRGSEDRAYTAGLLHDIGRLGLFLADGATYAALLSADEGAVNLDKEREAFGVDHCEAGAWLAKAWGFPEELQHVVATHHDPPGDGAKFELADLVRVGVLLTDWLGFDVAPPTQAYGMAHLRALLPKPAQYRFDPDPAELKSKLTFQLDAFD